MVDIIDYKNVSTKDENMKPDDSDKMFFGLIDLLVQNNIYGTADTALKFIRDEHTNQYLMTKAKIRIKQSEYLDATAALDELLSH